MAQLYALYDRIMSCIPKRTFLSMVNLLYFAGILPSWDNDRYALAFAAEWLHMTPEIAYGCLHHLHSVLYIPPTPEDAVEESVEVHHKSFKDYLAKRYSGAKEEFEKVALDAAVAILKEISQKGNVTDPQPWECLMLCWPNHDCKEGLYYGASGTIQSSKLTCSRTISRDSDTIQALRVMTPCKIGLDYLPLESSLDTWLTEDVTVVHVLKELQVFQPAQVGNLDLDRIWESWEDFHVLYFSKYPSQVSPRTQAQIVCNDYGDCVHEWETSIKKGNHYLTMRTIPWGQCRCCERLKNDLMNAQANTPDTIVATWTGGDGWGLVIYDFVDPDNQEIEWRYIMPCAPPGYGCL
ncbi:hypothetical protein AN958_05975 [Leucoagaricus sp. SymC.cos]|nr:hypothetical protein AN958_05975 [Leucoagaricus sp. SymC.cos]